MSAPLQLEALTVSEADDLAVLLVRRLGGGAYRIRLVASVQGNAPILPSTRLDAIEIHELVDALDGTYQPILEN